MANTLRFKRGLAAGITPGVAGEPLFTTDTFDLYIGNGTTNTRFQKYIASGTTSQLLRGDGSLLTMPIVLTSPANGEVLKYNGTTWVNSSDAGITGSGLAGQVAYFTGATTQAGSNNLFWDNTAIRLGVGRIPTARRFEIQVGFGGVAQAIGMYDGNGTINNIIGFDTVSSNDMQIAAVAGIRFYSGSTLGNVVTNPTNERMRLYSATGNLALGGTFASDSGQRLQVTGTSYLNGSVGIGAAPLSAATLYLAKTITGSGYGYGVLQEGVIQSNVTSFSMGFYNLLQTQATSFTLNNYYHYFAQQATLGAGSTINSQYGYTVDPTLIGATNNYGFYGNIAAGTGRWNLYMNGTASNFLSGDTQIGTGALTSEKLQVNGTMKVTGATTFDSSDIKAQGYRILKNGSDAITFSFYQQSISGTVYGNSMQMGASGDIQFWNYNAAWNKQLSIGITGAATFSSSVTAGGNLLLTNGTAASIGAINLIRTGTSPVASRMTFGTDDTGYSFAIAKNVTGTVTDLVTIADSGAATFSSSIQAASATITGNLTVDSSTLFVDATANEVGIGTNAPNSVLQVVGSVSKSISDVKTANYTATATDHTILCSAAGGGFTITLPAASGITGRIYVIKKTNASSGVNSVTVDGNGSETIDGSASINLACRSSVMLQCDGSNWHILSLYSDSSCL